MDAANAKPVSNILKTSASVGFSPLACKYNLRVFSVKKTQTPQAITVKISTNIQAAKSVLWEASKSAVFAAVRPT